MQPFMIFKPDALCALLSKPKEELTAMELAIREAMEAANTPDELEAFREKACLTNADGDIGVTKTGKTFKI